MQAELKHSPMRGSTAFLLGKFDSAHSCLGKLATLLPFLPALINTKHPNIALLCSALLQLLHSQHPHTLDSDPHRMSAGWPPLRPTPSLEKMPVDSSMTEPTRAYYKLQFGDEATGFSYYVQSPIIVIGRNPVRFPLCLEFQLTI